jgi:hypothetical protein
MQVWKITNMVMLRSQLCPATALQEGMHTKIQAFKCSKGLTHQTGRQQPRYPCLNLTMVYIVSGGDDSTLVEPAYNDRAQQHIVAIACFTSVGLQLTTMPSMLLPTCRSTPQQSCHLCGHLHTQTPQCTLHIKQLR